MKTIFLFILLVTAFKIDAQEPAYKSIAYKVEVKGLPGRIGWLKGISDSSIVISALPVSFNPGANMKGPERQISYQNLPAVFIRRKGSTGRGLLMGTLTGAVIGAIGGFSDGSDEECSNPYGTSYGFSVCGPSYTAGEKAAAGSVAFGFVGGIVGTLVGAIFHKSFYIERDEQKFNSFRNRMLKKVSKKRTKA